MIGSHKIEELVGVEKFTKWIKSFDPDKVFCSEHTFFRLSEKQSEVFNCDAIKEYLFNRKPVLVGIQYNGCYALFYKYNKRRFLRIIIDIKVHKINVVTFYIVEKNQLPVIK